MENKETTNEKKYNAIVDIKELLIETRVKNREELENTELISLNASKVLRLIYKYDELEEFYNGKVQEYKKLIQNKEQYQDAIKARDEQIFSYIPNKYIYKNVPLGYMEFRIKFSEIFKKPYASEIMDFFINDIIQNTKGKIYFSVFQYVDRIRTYFDSHIIPTYVFDCKKQLDMYKLFSYGDDDKFRNDIRNLYDYFFMSRYELLTSMDEVYVSLETKFYLYAVYQKILKDCLNHAYSLNLSEEEKQEQIEKMKKLNDARDKLNPYPEKLMIFNQIFADRNITGETIAKNISKMRNKKMTKSTVYNHCRNNGNNKGIVTILTGKDGSFTDLQEYIKTLI